MKTLLTIAVFTFSVSIIFAQDLNLNDKTLERAGKNYLKSLDHWNHGVVENAITNIMIMKTLFPEGNYSEHADRLDDLSIASPVKMIRYKAFVASNYLKHPERFNWIQRGDFENVVSFFGTYSEKLNSLMYLKEQRTEVTLGN